MSARPGTTARAAAALSKLCVNLHLRRDWFVLSPDENAAVRRSATIDRPVWIDPRMVRWGVRRIQFGNVVTFQDMSGLVHDLSAEPTIQFFDEILRQRRPYTDTTLYRLVEGGLVRRKRLGTGKAPPVALGVGNFVEYYDQCMRHAEAVAEGGLHPYDKSTTHRRGRDTDIATLVSASGEIMFFRRGNHRLGIAKALGLERIPVRIFMMSGIFLRQQAGGAAYFPWSLAAAIGRGAVQALASSSSSRPRHSC